MQIVDTREDFLFKIIGSKTFAVQAGNDSEIFCPFCYNPAKNGDEKCPSCGKYIPEVIYYHGDDDTWIASGKE